MQLLFHLVMRLVGVASLCLAGAVGWSMHDAHRAVEAAASASADRAGERLQALYWQKLLWRDGMSRETLLPSPEWETLATLNVLSPGVCMTFAPPGAQARTLCNRAGTAGEAAPTWFASLDRRLFGPHVPIARPLTLRDRNAGTVTASVEPEAALALSWGRASVAIGVAAAMAASISLLAALMFGGALRPARAIIRELRKLEQGDYSRRLPVFRATEFDRIACAVNALAARLARTQAARAALMARLFRVEEEERRALARDLHDEFGQCLTATLALATLIETGAAPDRKDLAQDARAIATLQKRMMQTLRGTLSRLRAQHIEEVGLEASLRQLVADYTLQSASKAVFRLDVAGPLTDLPRQVAVDVYRIAQECLTNAARHGTPTEVRLSVERLPGAPRSVALTVEDDGGGDAARIDQAPGHGILGVRERIAALGGSLSIGRAAEGVRIAAIIPVLTMDCGSSVGVYA